MKYKFIGVILLLLFTACKKESMEEIPIIHTSCGDQDSLAVYKIIFQHIPATYFFMLRLMTRASSAKLMKNSQNLLKTD